MIGSGAGGGHGPGGSPRGGVTTQKGGDVWFFKRNSTEQEFERLWKEIDAVKRQFAQIQQEWDATVDRVSKTLRRIRRTEQAQDAKEEFVENAATTLPLTLNTSSDRMTRIREQLAARGGKE